MKLDRVTPESVGIPSEKIEALLEALPTTGAEIHSFMLLRHGKVYAEGCARPYDAHTPHIMFSFSKSLTSTAIGFAEQEGILSLDEKLVDIFPELLPAQVSENLSACCIEDLLMMGCGHETGFTEWQDEEWIKKFLSHPFVYKPGSHFLYNTVGTNMLCAILQKKTGISLTAFLKPRLFDPLEMDNVTCLVLPGGIEAGGFGIKLVIEDMAKFTQFIANRGVWNGKSLLQDSWWERATTKRIDNLVLGTSISDWSMGYGYQYWCCQPEGAFRGDGAFGQYGIVMPKQDAVFVMTSAEINMQACLDAIWEILLPAMGDESLEENPGACQSLRRTCADLALPEMISIRNPASEQKLSNTSFVPTNSQPSFLNIIGGTGRLASTPGNLLNISFKFEPDQGYLCLEEEGRSYQINLGLCSRFVCTKVEDEPYWAVSRWRRYNKLEAEIRNTRTCSGTRFLFTFEDRKMTLTADCTMPESEGLVDKPIEDILFHVDET